MKWTGQQKIEGMTGFKDHGYTFIAQQPIIKYWRHSHAARRKTQDARSAQLSSYANEYSLGGKGIIVHTVQGVRGQ